jgi:two-component system, chemotaxis family, protein-glutamate methylesterase/glutaminase
MRKGVRPQASGVSTTDRHPRPEARRLTPELIVVGCSLGGMNAMRTLLCALPRNFRVPLAVVQHRHKQSDGGLPSFLYRECKLPVVDVEDKQWIKPGMVYLAPANYHLLVAKGEFNLSVDAAVRQSRPSVDVLFESAADAYGPRLIAVVLTGANADGARGAQRVKQRGGMVIVQDPETAEASEMPRAVIATGTVDRILRLKEIAPFLVEHCGAALHR